MEKKGWLALGLVFCIITIVLIVLVIVLPLVTKENKGKDDWHEQSLPKKSNTDLWASFPGKLETKTTHTFSIFDYTEIKNKAKIIDNISLEEATKYENFEFVDKENKAFFDAKSTFTLNSELKEKNEPINTLNLGLFEALETLSNPPLYQKGINSIYYLCLKAFQSADIFIRHLFASSIYKSVIKDEQKVLENILNKVDSEKAKKILSTDSKYAKYSFKTIAGFYQWVKILQKPEEIKAASWLSDLFELTNDEINSILGDDQYLNNEYVKCNAELATTFNCKDSRKCGNELIYTQLISGEVTKKIDSSLDGLKALLKEINEYVYPFYSSPELNIYFEEYKTKTGQTDIKYDDYKIEENTLEKLMEQNSAISLLSANNSVLFLSLVQTKNEENLSKLFGLTLQQSLFLCDYFYEFLPKLFLYQEFTDGGNTYTINAGARTFYNLIEKYVEQTYYPLIHTEHNIYNLFFAKYVWRGLHYSLLNLSMEYDDEDICPLLMQHALDDGKKVLKICSDPITAFKTPLEILKWYDPYPCVKSGDESKCNMTVVDHLRSIVYITEDEIKSIYDQGGLGKLFEDNDNELKQAFNCDGACTNDYLCKIQFWKSGVTKNLPPGLSTTDTLYEIFPNEFPFPMELTYFAKQIGYSGEFLEEDINDLISLSPCKLNGILNEENYEAYNNKVKLEKEYTLFMNGKASQEKRYDAMNVLNNVFLFSKDISSKYDNADNVLQGSSIDKKYLDFLSSGEYYENYKPGIQKTTGFNFGINLSSGNGNSVQYDRYGIITEDNKNLRKIISINNCPILNIQKLEYNSLTNNYTYINSPLYNFQTLTGDKYFIDGFQYDHVEDSIYYYDKISSRPFKFNYTQDVSYGDQSCRKYVLDENDLSNGINEKDDLDSNKAFLSQKLNKPFVVTVGKDDLDTEVEDQLSTENYICIQPDSNMVLDSKINFVYALYTKKYGFIDSNIDNDKLYPIFAYNRNYEVNINSFNSIFEEKEEKKLGSTFIISGVVLIVLLALISCFFFYKYFTYRRKRISLNNDEPSQALINDTRGPTSGGTKIEALD